VPWPDDAQVEQDLVLSRAIVEIFSVSRTTDGLVLRGRTALYKLFISPPARYSEDIDLVQRHAGPIGDILDAIRSRLDPWLGDPRRNRGPGGMTLTYRFESEATPAGPLRLKIEINTREHFSALDVENRPLSVDNPWFRGEARVPVYALNELLGTKMRALYQRKKGRDLFDLWLALDRRLADPELIVACFRRYMDAGGTPVSQAQYEANLQAKSADPRFARDVRLLLAPDVQYDGQTALDLIRERLVSRLPGEPWKGSDRRPAT